MVRRLGRRWWAVLALAALGVTGCTGPPPAGPSDPPPTQALTGPVVVDTDLAVDDLVDLAYLLSSGAEVRAIAVSGAGEVRCPQGLAVVRGVLALTGDDDVPVACGRSTPLAGSHTFPDGWRDAADSGWGLELGPSGPAAVDAVTLLRDAWSDEDVTVLTLGPLTDVAEALRAEPGAAGRIAQIVVMGGSIDAGGNIAEPGVGAAFSEWNVYVDPTAAAEVLGSGIPVVMVGLDATDRAPVTIDFLERLRANRTTPVAQAVHGLLEQNPLVYSGDAYFWDPLAAAVVVDPSVVTTERMSVSVITDEGPQSGRTVRDDAGTDVAVAVGADRDRLEDLLIRGLNGMAADEDVVEPPEPVATARIRAEGGVCAYEGPTTVTAGRMRVGFVGDDTAVVAALVHLTGVLSVEEILDWLSSNRGSNEQPPGIDAATSIPVGGEVFLDVLPGTSVVVCADLGDDLTVGPTIQAD